MPATVDGLNHSVFCLRHGCNWQLFLSYNSPSSAEITRGPFNVRRLQVCNVLIALRLPRLSLTKPYPRQSLPSGHPRQQKTILNDRAIAPVAMSVAPKMPPRLKRAISSRKGILLCPTLPKAREQLYPSLAEIRKIPIIGRR